MFATITITVLVIIFLSAALRVLTSMNVASYSGLDELSRPKGRG